VLDGIFAQAVIVVEADGDRVVYQAAWETMLEDFRTDIHFSTVGGTGGIADTCHLYRTLQIPVAVVADLDMIVDRNKMARVLQALIDDASVCEKLARECNEIADEIRGVPPEISAVDVAMELAALGGASMDWSKGDDIEIKRRLTRLATSIDRMRRLKKGGVDEFSGVLGDRLTGMLKELGEFGLFLVPVGELEEWLMNHGVSESKSHKRAWANSAAQRIHQLGKHGGDVWDFIATVVRYLVSRPPGGAPPNQPLKLTGTSMPAA
jgi:hypothetical protein